MLLHQRVLAHHRIALILRVQSRWPFARVPQLLFITSLYYLDEPCLPSIYRDVLQIFQQTLYQFCGRSSRLISDKVVGFPEVDGLLNVNCFFSFVARCSAFSVSICTLMLEKHVNSVPVRSTCLHIGLSARLRVRRLSLLTSICTFVLVKLV